MALETRSTDRFTDIDHLLDSQAVAVENNRVQLEQNTWDIGHLKQVMLCIESHLQELNGTIKNLAPSRVGEQQGDPQGALCVNHHCNLEHTTPTPMAIFLQRDSVAWNFQSSMAQIFEVGHIAIDSSLQWTACILINVSV